MDQEIKRAIDNALINIRLEVSEIDSAVAECVRKIENKIEHIEELVRRVNT